MSADTLASSSLNAFGLAGHVSPSEQIYVLSSNQLQDIIERAVARATAPLGGRIQDLEDQQLQDADRFSRDIASDRRRIARLENPEKEPGKTVLSRVEKIEKYLVARPDHRATFEVLKGHLGINNVLLGDAIETLMKASPGRYTVGKANGDKRRRVLIMLPKY